MSIDVIKYLNRESWSLTFYKQENKVKKIINYCKLI